MFRRSEQLPPIRLILLVLAMLLFGFAAFALPRVPEPWPWRVKLIAAGLFCLTLAEFF